MNPEDLEALAAEAKAKMRSISQRMLEASEAGELNDDDINAWYAQMQEEIAAYHQAAALLGTKDGKPPTNDWALTNRIAKQLGYLKQFYEQVKEAGQFTAASVARAGMYGSAVRSTYWEAATDYLPLPAMPGDGTLCYTNCKCSWQIDRRDGVGNYDCYWRRAADDSCGTCIARERMWSPLLVRDGELQ